MWCYLSFFCQYAYTHIGDYQILMPNYAPILPEPEFVGKCTHKVYALEKCAPIENATRAYFDIASMFRDTVCSEKHSNISK